MGDQNIIKPLVLTNRGYFKQMMLIILVFVAIAAAFYRILKYTRPFLRWGIMVSFLALIYGGSSLYQYYTYNSIVSNPVLAKKGRKTILLGALLLVALLVAVILIADATIPPAS